ncbi:hypothetical protein VNO78_22220 [Psophocarpus tetragonolobus]|uniref:F-box domain-containing protein n=1 Tax=Psophocarpus tetragonolobus TaxID=3891 RepID=A0AAN9SE10_PSOTE
MSDCGFAHVVMSEEYEKQIAKAGLNLFNTRPQSGVRLKTQVKEDRSKSRRNVRVPLAGLNLFNTRPQSGVRLKTQVKEDRSKSRHRFPPVRHETSEWSSTEDPNKGGWTKVQTQVSTEEGKEIKKNLTMDVKRQSIGGRDRLSELPECVLLHILNYMDTIYAVRTCVLSKRWKDLWKLLTTLSFLHPYFIIKVDNFSKFVSHVLSSRDSSISVLNMCFSGINQTDAELMNRAITYAASHNVQQLTIQMPFDFTDKPHCFNPLIFSCPSLTFLKLHKSHSGPPLELPKSLQLPALETLSLSNIIFTARDNACAGPEPFSTCSLLNTLILTRCFLQNGAKVLFISNSKLSSLNLQDCFQHKVVLSTPNLSSLTISPRLGFHHQPLFSSCNLSCLEEGTIHVNKNTSCSVLTNWLQVFSNVKILTLSYLTLKMMLSVISDHATMIRFQPPRFVKLESLKVTMNEISYQQLNRVVQYLLQNSSLTVAVKIIPSLTI